MRLRKLTCYALNIPFVEEFRHSAKARAFSDSIVLRLEDADGAVGYGEAVPRPYVTGESVETCMEAMAGRFWDGLKERELPGPGDGLLERLAEGLDPLTEPGPGPVLAWNAARCAWELALVDLVLGKAGRSVGDILPPKRKSVAYSGVITSGSPEKAAKTARHLGAFGIRTLKIKTGGPQDAEVVAAVRQAAGPTAALRVDANAAYAPEEAAARLAALAIHGIESAEQPIPRGDLAAWAALRAASPIPLMADESLVTLADGEALAAAGACDLFNIRLSKCGGFLPCLRLADVARRAGLRIQIGCQVGETALLSAAGRHLAAHLDDLAWVEGSFGTLLLSRDISRSKVQFGHGGNAPVLRGPGLGVDVDEEAPRAHAVAVIGREA